MNAPFYCVSAAATGLGMIEMRFQPIVRLSDGVPVALEALARLRDPDRGMVPASVFVPALETAGLGHALAGRVVAQALADLPASLLESEHLCLSVNLPLDVFLAADAVGRLDRQRRTASIPTSHLVIELTESQPVDDLPGLTAAVRRWRAAGYRVAIDDVGPQTPLLDGLLPLFDTVKLDMSIVRDAGSPAARFIGALVEGTRARGQTVVGEGVEDWTVWGRMRGLGVDLAQGFLLSEPIEATRLLPWLAAWRRAGMAEAAG